METYTQSSPQINQAAYANVTRIVKLRGQEIKIHALCTGTVAIKNSFKKKSAWGPFAKANILLDPHYTEYLPIWVWVIEHPEGIIVIDTGENEEITDLDRYLAKESWFLRYQFKHAAKFSIQATQSLPYQLASVGLCSEDIKLVVLTHLHLDHTDGLRFFPTQEIIVGNYELKHPNNHMPSTYPTWFKPNPVQYQDNRIEIFNHAYPVNQAEDLLYIPTPGHTLGHSSLVFKTDDFDIIFAGDSSYTQEQVLQRELAGVNAHYPKSLQSYEKLLDYAALRKTIYLPTHDPQAGQSLLHQHFLI